MIKKLLLEKRLEVFVASMRFLFFVKDIRQLCFNPFESDEYKYSVMIKTVLSNENFYINISKEKYEYLMDKLGANDDED